MTYATVEQANDYHAARLSAEAWSALDPAQQQAALQSATDALDLYAAQAGGWKAEYSTNTPEPIVRACAEHALALTDGTTQERLRAQMQGVAASSIGSASESYTGAGKAVATGMMPMVDALLLPYLRRARGGAPIV